MSERTVTVQGTVYNTRTGMPLHLERTSQHTKSAQQVHNHLQKSRTLNRKYVHRDTEPQVHTKEYAPSVHTIGMHHTIKPPVVSPAKHVTHFAKPAPATPSHNNIISDIGPAPHALVANAARKLAKPEMQTIVKPSQVLKQEAITKAMSQTPAKHDHQERAPSRYSKHKRIASIASASLCILLLGGYFTYLSMPTLSTKVAASQAGIDASYPGYQPTGYSLNGPVAYQAGKVTMTFAANASPTSYTLDQTRSGWDSSAVLDDYVKPKAGDDYETTTSNGLTIFTYGSNAAWVNRGIFYTISGNAPLSSEQIQHIATSL